MPVSRFYNPVSGKVQTPDPNDPVGMQQLGNTTYFDFGAQQAFGQMPAPVTPSETGAEAYLKALGRIPDMPRDLMRMNKQQRQQIGYEPSMSIGDLRLADEQAMKSKPAQSNVINRGGMGKAGRGGKSQFDLGPQFLPDSADWPGLEPLEMPSSDVSDKPWDLDDNTNADVAPGTKLDPQPEKPVAPDLNTPRGMFEALSKKYPDILTRNLEEMEQARVTPQDVESLSDRAGLGSLFIAASKAASSAGAVGGKQAESIAPQIVQREDTLARQRLKDRLDVADSNMSLSAKAVDLAMKQINFADEREQYDQNSEVSRFARDFMRSEFDVNVPDNVPAYQLKQFLPAVVQKYQAAERAKYQSALLGQKTAENLLNDAYKRYKVATESGDKQAQLEAEKDIVRLKAMEKPAVKTEQTLLDQAYAELDTANRSGDINAIQKAEQKIRNLRQLSKAPAAAKTTAKVPETPREKLQNKLIEKDAEVYQKRLQGLQKLDGGLQSLDEAKSAGEVVQIGQSLLKTLNDPENSDAVGAEEVKRLAAELQPFGLMTPGKLIQVGRDLPAFKDRVRKLRERLYNTANLQFKAINQKMPDLVDPPPTYGTPTGAASGMSPERKARLEELRRKLRGGQ